MPKWFLIIPVVVVIVVAGDIVWFTVFHSKRYLGVTPTNYLVTVKPGMTVEELKKTYGEPVIQREGPGESVIFSYLALPPTMQDMGQTNQFAGFEVAVKDGIVVNSYITVRANYLQTDAPNEASNTGKIPTQR